MPPELQELVHRLVYVLQHSSVSLLLGRKSQPDLDLLLYGHPDCVLGCTDRSFDFMGKGDTVR